MRVGMLGSGIRIELTGHLNKILLGLFWILTIIGQYNTTRKLQIKREMTYCQSKKEGTRYPYHHALEKFYFHVASAYNKCHQW